MKNSLCQAVFKKALINQSSHVLYFIRYSAFVCSSYKLCMKLFCSCSCNWISTGRDNRYILEELLVCISSCKFANFIFFTSCLACAEMLKKIRKPAGFFFLLTLSKIIIFSIFWGKEYIIITNYMEIVDIYFLIIYN